MSKKPHIYYTDLHFLYPYRVGFTQNPKAFKKEMKRLKIKSVDFMQNERANATTHCFTSHESEAMSIICIPETKCNLYHFVGLLAHEIQHVIQDLWIMIGEKHPGDEAEAYLMQYLIQNILYEIGGEFHKSVGE